MKQASMRILGIFSLPLLAIAFFVFTYPKERAVVTIQTSDKQYTILAEVADDEEERRVGLMGRERLSDEEAMLFILPGSGKPAFWMKNMLIPIDIIFIDVDGVVDTIERSVPPCPPEESCQYYGPEGNVLYVLELAAGWSDRYGLEVGDKILSER